MKKRKEGVRFPMWLLKSIGDLGGVLVVAQGGDDPALVQQIQEAAMALFHVEAHKIKVLNEMRREIVKKILKKNQIIITALAIMIAAAGYISYSDSKLDPVKTSSEKKGTEVTEETADMDSVLQDIESLDEDITEEMAAQSSEEGTETASAGGEIAEIGNISRILRYKRRGGGSAYGGIYIYGAGTNQPGTDSFSE